MLRRSLSLLSSSGRRLLSTITTAKLIRSPAGEPFVALHVAHDGRRGRLVLPLVWLRDHCLSDECYNHTTNQRKPNGTELTTKARIASDQAVSLDAAAQKLKIAWADGHLSTYDAKQIIDFAIKWEAAATSDLRTLWTAATFGKARPIPAVQLADLKFASLAEHFVRFGFVCIEGVERSAEATEKLCRQLAPFHDTFFGGFYVFNNKAQAQPEYHADTAYTNEAIGPHTDGTYFPQTPGIQVFHCLRPAEKGGETLLVDAFAAAERLKAEAPEAFRVLANTPIDHHYVEMDGDDAILSWAPEKHVIELDGNRRIRQIRFNPYDRAPFSAFTLRKEEESSSNEELPSDTEHVATFYSAYEKFSRICHDSSSALSISLQPGTVILVDNFRVLHARTAFTGFREMCGCYLSRDNFLAKARPLLSQRIRYDI